MDEEVFGLNIIFVTIIGSILLFTYYAIPSATLENKTAKAQVAHVTENEHPVSQPESESHGEQLAANDSHDENQSTETSHAKSQEVVKSEEVQSQVPVSLPPGSSEVAPIIAMNNPKYGSHKKGIATFTHEKHVTDYEISCGDCHHDEHGTPLELSKGDAVQNCIVCHTETKKPKGEKLDKNQRIAKYHFEAMHANCIGCHKPYNKEKGDPKGKGPAPTSCGACHPKNK